MYFEPSESDLLIGVVFRFTALGVLGGVLVRRWRRAWPLALLLLLVLGWKETSGLLLPWRLPPAARSGMWRTFAGVGGGLLLGLALLRTIGQRRARAPAA